MTAPAAGAAAPHPAAAPREKAAPRTAPARIALAALPLAWAALALAFLVRLGGWAPDDFYITYRYARNLARGLGFVFNPGERVFGTTDPGVGLLLGGLHALTRVDVPWLAAGVFATGLVATATLLLRSAAPGRRLEAALGGTLLVASALFWTNQGAAAPLVLAALLAAAALAGRRPGVAGALAGAAVWLRPDALLGLPLLAGLRWLETRRIPWRLLVAGAALVAAGLAAAWLWFGQPLPNTLGAKLDMAAATSRAATGLRFWERAAATQLPRQLGTAFPLLLAAGAAGAAAMARHGGRTERLLVAYGAGIAAAYTVLGVPFFAWYLLPAYAAALYGLGWVVARAAGAAAAALRRPRAAPAMAALLFAAAAWQPLARAADLVADPGPPVRTRTYRAAADWIRTNTPPAASVAYVEIGVVGYFGDRRLLDLMGLVSPEVRPFVAGDDLAGAFRRWPTDLVLHHSRGRLGGIVSSRWFRRHYREVATFTEPTRPGRPPQVLQVFARRAGRGRGAPDPAAAPAPAPSPPPTSSPVSAVSASSPAPRNAGAG